MKLSEYEQFDRQVERKLATGEWVTFGWSQMFEVADDKVVAGSVEKRFNEQTNRIEYRRL